MPNFLLSHWPSILCAYYPHHSLPCFPEPPSFSPIWWYVLHDHFWLSPFFRHVCIISVIFFLYSLSTNHPIRCRFRFFLLDICSALLNTSISVALSCCLLFFSATVYISAPYNRLFFMRISYILYFHFFPISELQNIPLRHSIIFLACVIRFVISLLSFQCFKFSQICVLAAEDNFICV